jgi:hypothetical protein
VFETLCSSGSVNCGDFHVDYGNFYRAMRALVVTFMCRVMMKTGEVRQASTEATRRETDTRRGECVLAVLMGGCVRGCVM